MNNNIGVNMHYNIKTEVEYTGKNILILEEAKEKNGFDNLGWITFLQAIEIGYRVKKGSKGTKLFRIVEVQSKIKNEEVKKQKGFTVFNFNQIEEVK